jgi:hypothetical protein
MARATRHVRPTPHSSEPQQQRGCAHRKLLHTRYAATLVRYTNSMLQAPSAVLTCNQVCHESCAAVNGAPHTACEPYNAPRPVAQAADTVQRGIDACTVVTTKFTNLHSEKIGSTGYCCATVCMRCIPIPAALFQRPAQLPPATSAACTT